MPPSFPTSGTGRVGQGHAPHDNWETKRHWNALSSHYQEGGKGTGSLTFAVRLRY